MAPPTTKTDREIGHSFDVTCTIGTVTLGQGERSPHVAAFMLIAEHDAPGTYSFPMPNGDTCVVDVHWKS